MNPPGKPFDDMTDEELKGWVESQSGADAWLVFSAASPAHFAQLSGELGISFDAVMDLRDRVRSIPAVIR